MSKFLTFETATRYVSMLIFATTFYLHGSGTISDEIARNVSGLLFGFGTGTAGALMVVSEE